MKFIDIGFKNLIAADKIITIVAPDSAPIKRVIQEARENGFLIDASFGRKTQSVIVMESNHIVLSYYDVEHFGQIMGE